MLNRYFKRREFCCPCCGFNTVDAELLMVLTGMRVHFGAEVNINSGCRCREYNEIIQKRENLDYVPYSSRSKHMEGKAVDIKVKDVSPKEVQKYLEKMYANKYGIGSYRTFTHIDVRSSKARW